MKLDNIMIGYPENVKDHRDHLHKIKLIDFGLAMKYNDDNGNHIPNTLGKFF